MFDELDKRLRRLETAVRFTSPSVSTNPANPKSADIIYNSTDSALKYWDGTAWRWIADNNVSSPLVTFTSSWTGTGLAYTGFPAQGVYQRVGKQIHFQIKVACTNVTNFGTGAYSLTLPFASAYDYIITGGLHDVSANNHYVLYADLNIGSTTMALWYPTANGALGLMKYNQPKTLTTTDYFYISGNYIAQ